MIINFSIMILLILMLIFFNMINIVMWMSILISSFLIFFFIPPIFISSKKKNTKEIFFSKFLENIKELLSVNSNFNFFFFEIISTMFMFILISNLSGLFVLEKQIFLTKMSFILLSMALSMWMFSYFPFFFSKKEKFTLYVIGEMKFPILSFLLSNIEILTHLFRPVTLTARLWVNIWVGHLIMSSISFLFWFKLMNEKFPMMTEGFQFFFFIFELGIMSLQTYVFSYLIKVYFEENWIHSA